MFIKCAPDRDGCIDLASIMRIMSQIDQEQAWALAYQLAALMQRLWPAGNNCATIESLAQIHINQSGSVHHKSIDFSARNNSNSNSSSNITNTTNTTNSSSNSVGDKQQHVESDLFSGERLGEERRRRASSEQELVSSLGIVLFRALDYGIPDDEERKLSRSMEYLIVQSQTGLTLAELEEICVQRLRAPGNKVSPEQHYREVCKALITDTIELSLLLDKIYTATMEMNGVSSASAKPQHHLQSTAPISASTNNNNQNNNNQDNNKLSRSKSAKENSSDILAHQEATDYLHLVARDTTQADYLHQQLLHSIDQDELSELGLPLASLRALKINEWARLWMQVIRELHQKRRFQQHKQRKQQFEPNEHAPSNDVLQAV